MKAGSKASKAIAAALCAVLATSPLLGCAGNAKKAQAPASSDSIVRDAGEDIESQGKKVPFSKTGAYTVTLKEADFAKAEGAENNARPAADAQANAEQATNAEPSEGIEVADDSSADQGTTAEKRGLAFADVRAEDIKVGYSVLTDRDEASGADAGDEARPDYEAREAQVNALSNDGGAITLSFTDPDAATNATSSYAIAIDALGLTATVSTDKARPTLGVESGSVKSDSESCDVVIRAQGDAFAAGASAADLKLGGSFGQMTVSGVEASGDTLTAHLSGKPHRDYETQATWRDGQVTVEASGFENSPSSATAYVPVDLPDEAFDTDGAEALPLASVSGTPEYVDFSGDAAKATLHLLADYGAFNDARPEGIRLENGFEGGRVESVSKEGGGNGLLKVEVSFPKNGQGENDYFVAGTLTLVAGAMDDDRGRPAPEVSTTVALYPEDAAKDGGDAEDAAKKAAEAEKKKREARAKTLGGVGEGFRYAGSYLERVDPTLGFVSQFGATTFGMLSDITAGNWLDVAKSGVGFLQMCGLVPAGEKEVAAKDVLEEVRALRGVVNSLDLKVTDISKEDREDRFTQTDVRLKKMQDRCTSAYEMFQRGADMLAKRKKNPMRAPAATATSAEVVRYNAELRSVMLREQELERTGKSKSTMFVDLDDTMRKLMDDLETVTKWISIDRNAINAGANPIDVLDKLVSTKFNWETQGYYARAAFRSELEFTIEDSWAVLSTYYNATDPEVVAKYQPQLDAVRQSLRQIGARPAGTSPDEVRRLNQSLKDGDEAKGGDEIDVYSPSLGFSIKHSRLCHGGQTVSQESDERTSDERVAEYARRLQGDLWDDLRLAGLEVGEKGAWPNFWGIGFRHAVHWSTNRGYGYDSLAGTWDDVNMLTLTYWAKTGRPPHPRPSGALGRWERG